MWLCVMEDSDQPRHQINLVIFYYQHEESSSPKLPMECTVKLMFRLGRVFAQCTPILLVGPNTQNTCV